MKRRLDRDIEAWLEAEAGGLDAPADEALVRVFRSVQRRRPRAGFSHAVLSAAGFAPAGAGWAPWLRVALVGCLVAAVMTAAALPWVLLAVKWAVQLAAWPLLASLWRAGTRSASFILWCSAVAGDVLTALRLSVATPTGVGLLLGNVLVGAGSFFGLKRLLGDTRSYSNAS
jgi:hypothetical protein